MRNKFYNKQHTQKVRHFWKISSMENTCAHACFVVKYTWVCMYNVHTAARAYSPLFLEAARKRYSLKTTNDLSLDALWRAGVRSVCPSDERCRRRRRRWSKRATHWWTVTANSPRITVRIHRWDFGGKYTWTNGRSACRFWHFRSASSWANCSRIMVSKWFDRILFISVVEEVISRMIQMHWG